MSDSAIRISLFRRTRRPGVLRRTRPLGPVAPSPRTRNNPTETSTLRHSPLLALAQSPPPAPARAPAALPTHPFSPLLPWPAARSRPPLLPRPLALTAPPWSARAPRAFPLLQACSRSLRVPAPPPVCLRTVRGTVRRARRAFPAPPPLPPARQSAAPARQSAAPAPCTSVRRPGTVRVSPPPLLPARPPPLRPARRRQSAAPAPCALVRRPDTVRVSPPAQHRAPHSAGPASGPCASVRRPGIVRVRRPVLGAGRRPGPASSRRPGTLCVSPPGRRPGQYGAPPQYSACQFTASASCASVRCPGTLCVSPPGRRPGQPGSTLRRLPDTVRVSSHIHTAFFQWKRHFFPAAHTPTGSTFRSDSSVFGRTYSTCLH